jgi:SAM-dependent methyltransferase
MLTMESDNFTGERPGWGADFDYDEARHLAAYIYAAGLAKGRRVLDAGCGEGFGTQTLAATAADVTGVDYSADAIGFCLKRWDAPRLSFRQVDLTAPGDFTDTFDLVLNFQVVEHIDDATPFIEGLRERVAPGGQLMLTTPNRLKTFSENPYHVREYTRDELAALLGNVFSKVEILGMHGNEKVSSFDRGREKAVHRILRLDPLGIRNLLPRKVIELAFAKLAVIVRRQARDDSAADTIVPADFFVSGANVDEALDLVALCRP